LLRNGQLFSLSELLNRMEVAMSRHAFSLWIISLVFAAWITLACGGGGARQIQSVSVSPASADAQNYPNGQVPFVATGYYNSAPATVTPLQANWGAALGTIPAGGAVTVDSNGMAQCTTGASGTYTIGAWINLPVQGIPPCPSFAFGAASCNYVLGTAKLTCP
jgi:hypothetical protein